MADLKSDAIDQLSEILFEFEESRRCSRYDDLSDLSQAEIYRLITSSHAALKRWAPPGSSYLSDAERVIAIYPPGHCDIAIGLWGISTALREDYKKDRLISLRELVHANLFSDYLDMAEHLLDEGYKDPAAVIIGSSLEAHLRKLSDKSSLPTTKQNGDAIKASMLNDELARAEIYSKNEQKNVTAWLAIRNDAAHGNYTAYTNEQVRVLRLGVRDFINRYPA